MRSLERAWWRRGVNELLVADYDRWMKRLTKVQGCEITGVWCLLLVGWVYHSSVLEKNYLIH